MGRLEYSTEYDGERRVVRHKVWGLHDSPEDAHPSIGAATSLARAKNCRNVLFDLSGLRLDVTPVDTMNMTSDFDRAGLARGLGCAVIVVEMSEEHRLTANLAANRGYNVKLFDKEPAAFQWLSSDESYPGA